MATSQKTFANRMKNIFGMGTSKDNLRGTIPQLLLKKIQQEELKEYLNL